jgi:hypothetical protein
MLERATNADAAGTTTIFIIVYNTTNIMSSSPKQLQARVKSTGSTATKASLL